MKWEHKIGDTVSFTHETIMVYDEDGNRHAEHKPVNPPACGVIVGGCYRRTGKYKQGGSHSTLDGYDSWPAELHVTGTVPVYRVSKTFTGKPVDVLPEHIELMEAGHGRPTGEA